MEDLEDFKVLFNLPGFLVSGLYGSRFLFVLPGFLSLWVLGFLGFWIVGCLACWVPACLDFWIPWFWVSEILVCFLLLWALGLLCSHESLGFSGGLVFLRFWVDVSLAFWVSGFVGFWLLRVLVGCLWGLVGCLCLEWLELAWDLAV